MSVLDLKNVGSQLLLLMAHAVLGAEQDTLKRGFLSSEVFCLVS